MKVEVKDGAITYCRNDGVPIARFGNIGDGKFGVTIAKQKQRIFAMDNVIRFRHLSANSIKRTMGEL